MTAGAEETAAGGTAREKTLTAGAEETAAGETAAGETAAEETAAGETAGENVGNVRKAEATGRIVTGNRGIYAGTAVKKELPLPVRNGREALGMRVNNC